MTCRSSLDRCRLLRTCAKCHMVLSSKGRRHVHQNRCSEPLDAALVTEQNLHQRRHHRT